MKTYSPKAKDIQRVWFVVDADGATLGRLASEVAHVLRGKHKPTFAPHMDMGDHVIVVNAEKIRVTGAKAADKIYYHHSQYPGGLSEIPYERLAAKRPERIIERAIRGMLPRNRLGRQMLRKLAVYAGGEHPHAAQMPAPLELKSARRAATDEKAPAAKAPEKASAAAEQEKAPAKAAAEKAPAKAVDEKAPAASDEKAPVEAGEES